MNRADVVLLNQSLQELGNTMFRNRMMRQREKEGVAADAKDERRYQDSQADRAQTRQDTQADRERAFTTGRQDRAEDVSYRATQSKGEADFRSSMIEHRLRQDRKTELDRMDQNAKIEKALQSEEARTAIGNLDKQFQTFDQLHAGATDEEYAAAAKDQVKGFKEIYDKFLGKSAWAQFLNPDAKVNRAKKAAPVDPMATQTETEDQFSTAMGPDGKPLKDANELNVLNKRTIRRIVPAGGGGSAAPTAGKGRPTRAIAAKFVAEHGQANAIAELKKAGYDPSGYAD